MRYEFPHSQHQSAYSRHRSLMVTFSRQTRASRAPPWSLKGSERELSPPLRQHRHEWTPEVLSTSAMPSWQQDQWPAQWLYWNAWGMLVMPMPF